MDFVAVSHMNNNSGALYHLVATYGVDITGLGESKSIPRLNPKSQILSLKHYIKINIYMPIVLSSIKDTSKLVQSY